MSERATNARGMTKRGRETRERILAAAASLILEHGASETTLEDIRSAAGVSGSQVYHYFASKDELIHAVIDQQTDAVLAGQEPEISNLDSIAGLRAWRDLLVALQEERQCRGGCPIGSLGSEVAEVDDVARMQVVAGFSRWEARILEGLVSMHRRGDLPPNAEPEDLALALLASLQGGLMLAQFQRDVRPLAVALDTTINGIEAIAHLQTV